MDHGGNPENYTGQMIGAGQELGFSAKGIVGWEVLAPTNDLPHGELAGRNWRTGGGAAPALGIEPKRLVSPSHRSLALEPLSVAGENLTFGSPASGFGRRAERGLSVRWPDVRTRVSVSRGLGFRKRNFCSQRQPRRLINCKFTVAGTGVAANVPTNSGLFGSPQKISANTRL